MGTSRWSRPESRVVSGFCASFLQFTHWRPDVYRPSNNCLRNLKYPSCPFREHCRTICERTICWTLHSMRTTKWSEIDWRPTQESTRKAGRKFVWNIYSRQLQFVNTCNILVPCLWLLKALTEKALGSNICHTGPWEKQNKLSNLFVTMKTKFTWWHGRIRATWHIANHHSNCHLLISFAWKPEFNFPRETAAYLLVRTDTRHNFFCRSSACGMHDLNKKENLCWLLWSSAISNSERKTWLQNYCSPVIQMLIMCWSPMPRGLDADKHPFLHTICFCFVEKPGKFSFPFTFMLLRINLQENRQLSCFICAGLSLGVLFVFTGEGAMWRSFPGPFRPHLEHGMCNLPQRKTTTPESSELICSCKLRKHTKQNLQGKESERLWKHEKLLETKRSAWAFHFEAQKNAVGFSTKEFITYAFMLITVPQCTSGSSTVCFMTSPLNWETCKYATPKMLRFWCLPQVHLQFNVIILTSFSARSGSFFSDSATLRIYKSRKKLFWRRVVITVMYGKKNYFSFSLPEGEECLI